MKKSLLAIALLGAYVGGASAASSVTLWGRLDTQYDIKTTKTTNTSTNAVGTLIGPTALGSVTTKTNSRVRQSDSAESRIGIRVVEDLGNGMSAFVRLEGSMTSDVGSSIGFNRESVVGLKGNFGSFYFGRSVAPIDQISVSEGRRSSDIASYIASTNRWSNAAFYHFNKGDWTVWAGVTTPGGQYNNLNATEQQRIDATYGKDTGNSRKMAYGLAVKYAHTLNERNKFDVAAAFQAQNDNFHNQNTKFVNTQATQTAVLPFSIGATYANHSVTAAVRNEWLVAANYTFSPTAATPIRFGLQYARANYNTSAVSSVWGQDQLPTKAHGQKFRALVMARVTPNDEVFFQYTGERDKYSDSTSAFFRRSGQVMNASNRVDTYALGYTHYLSKRTSINADYAYQVSKFNSYYADGNGSATVSHDRTNKKLNAFNIGLRHKF